MPSLIPIEGEITLHDLERFYELLQSALQDPDGVFLSCEGLTYLDTAAFQLLISIKKTLGNRPLVLQKVPEAILESADLLGLTAFLKLRG